MIAIALSPDGSRLASTTGRYQFGDYKYEPAPETGPSGRVFDVFIGGEDMDAWTAEFPAPGLTFGFAAEDHMFVITVFLVDPRLIEPQASHIVPIAVDQHSDE